MGTGLVYRQPALFKKEWTLEALGMDGARWGFRTFLVVAEGLGSNPNPNPNPKKARALTLIGKGSGAWPIGPRSRRQVARAC